MKPVLILQHQTPENLAYLSTWLLNHKIGYVTFNAETDKEFPSSIEPYSALALMGGAMSANDRLYTNRQAEILILQALYKDIPIIGHCLGGQLMAKALGGTITKSPKPEIGWQPIKYKPSTEAMSWFGTDPTDTVIHWHYDMFSLPEGANLLASSEACPNQAFSYGKHLAMQFHIEIDEFKVNRWVNDEDTQWYDAQKIYNTVQNKQQMLDGIELYLKNHQSTADSIYTNWLKTTIWAENLDRVDKYKYIQKLKV